MDDLIDYSITYRVDRHAGQMVLPCRPRRRGRRGPGQGLPATSLPLHTELGVAAGQRSKLERLARCVSRVDLMARLAALVPPTGLRLTGIMGRPLRTLHGERQSRWRSAGQRAVG